MKKVISLLISLFLCISVASCTSQAKDAVTVDGKFGEKPIVKVDSSVTPPKQLESKVLKKGNGPALTKENVASVDYYGMVWNGKKPFDESFSRPEPFNFALNKGVIAGWTKGLVGKNVGSRVLLIIPPELGYGKAGSPPSIPSNATLVFVIDIYGSNSKKDRSIISKSKTVSEGADGVIVSGEPTETPTVKFEGNAKLPEKNKLTVLREGTGEKLSEGDLAEVFPTVYKWGGKNPDGKIETKNKMLPFVLPISQKAKTVDFKDLKIGSRVLYVQLVPAEAKSDKSQPEAYVYVFDIVGKVGSRK